MKKKTKLIFFFSELAIDHDLAPVDLPLPSPEDIQEFVEQEEPADNAAPANDPGVEWGPGALW